MDYQPACFQCRVDAGNDVAGVKDTSLCVPHLKLRCADLTRELELEVARLRKLLKEIGKYLEKQYQMFPNYSPERKFAKAALEASE